MNLYSNTYKEMSKLKLEYLAPYLPYNLNVARTDIGQKFKRIEGRMDTFLILDVIQYRNIKPILRPLSDLTKEIEHNGEKFVPIEVLELECGWSYFDSEILPFLNWPFGVITKLLEWHFDIFGGIGDWAVDINTLKK